MYTEATALARKAVAANPNDTWGHFQLAAANGKRLLLLGKKEQIDASKAVRAEIDKAIELDPTNHLAYHALGRWHRRMDEIGGAKRFFGSLIYGSIPKGSYAESEKWPCGRPSSSTPNTSTTTSSSAGPSSPSRRYDEAAAVLPEGDRPAQDDLEGRRPEGRGQDGARRSSKTRRSRPARAGALFGKDLGGEDLDLRPRLPFLGTEARP